jgi:poly-gamma-glutamate synthesis protein (capsule biosynthesis protein)
MISCCSTFAKGNEAGAQRPDLPGRPGLNPLHVETVHEVTEQQLAVLREVADQLGLEAERQQKIKSGFAFPLADPALFPLGDLKFKSANQAQVRTSPNGKDVAAMMRWVREARGLADLVLVSLHAHEQLGAKDVPAEFIGAFAREMIEAGADLVVGHGPHLLRGLELYKGKPIFYSLGNFIGQNELVAKIPADGYDRFRAEPDLTPGQVYQKRTQGDQAGFPADRRYWESIMPTLSYRAGPNGRMTLHSIELTPVSLGWKEARHRRGRPRIAGVEEGRAILDRFAGLSRPFGTELRSDGQSVRLA